VPKTSPQNDIDPDEANRFGRRKTKMSKKNASEGSFRLVVMGREIISVNWNWSFGAAVVALASPAIITMLSHIS
jgi:hypothetical protein